MIRPSRAGSAHLLADGVEAVLPGLAWLPATRTLVVADAHFAYEEVVGAALPLWSTTAIVATLRLVVARMGAHEIVFLGDVVHGARMSDGAAARVRSALAELRGLCDVVLIAGNHEGKSRARAVLGATVASVRREGRLLIHGDVVPAGEERAIIGHLHPSLALGGGTAAPVFLASERLVVVPAMTPYSSGLDVLSEDCTEALARWDVRRRDLQVVAVTPERLYPFGTLSALGAALRVPTKRRGRPRPRRFLRSDR